MEKELTTKEKIVYESLKLFSKKGYNGVSMREIAAAVGIKGASIYNHFKGKQEVFEAIFEEMTKLYSQVAEYMNIPINDGMEAAETYEDMDVASLLKVAEGLFAFFTQNEFAVMYRRLIISEYAMQCLKGYYLDGPLVFQGNIFKGMQERGAFVGFDSEVLALHFYSPIYYILARFDVGYSYEECFELIKKHVEGFCRVYK